MENKIIITVLTVCLSTFCSYGQLTNPIDTNNPTPDGIELVTSDCDNDSFNLIPGEKYIISAWVKEEHVTQQITYSSTLDVFLYSELSSIGSGITLFSNSFTPSGKIIEGWQKITGIFTIPQDATAIKIELVNNNSATANVYFDDIRVLPFNGNMKSFVYDPQTQRLMAELDENNYATFYEYDAEGGLIRVKKETERGVVTIQETRSGNAKQGN